MLAPMFGDTPIRMIRGNADHGDLWVACDVCKVLGLRNPSQSLARLEPDRRGLVDATTGEPIDLAGSRPTLAVVTEPGLFDLIVRSRKPAARKFQTWITGEVLPALARSGSYSLAAKPEQALALPDRATLARLLATPEALALVAGALADHAAASAGRAAALADHAAALAGLEPAPRLAEPSQLATLAKPPAPARRPEQALDTIDVDAFEHEPERRQRSSLAAAPQVDHDHGPAHEPARAPKHRALALAEQITTRPGDLGVREVAKTLAIGERALVAWLVANRWLYRGHRGQLQACADLIKRGLAVHRVSTIQTRKGERVVTRMYLTPLALERIAERFASESKPEQASPEPERVSA